MDRLVCGQGGRGVRIEHPPEFFSPYPRVSIAQRDLIDYDWEGSRAISSFLINHPETAHLDEQARSEIAGISHQ